MRAIVTQRHYFLIKFDIEKLYNVYSFQVLFVWYIFVYMRKFVLHASHIEKETQNTRYINDINDFCGVNITKLTVEQKIH